MRLATNLCFRLAPLKHAGTAMQSSWAPRTPVEVLAMGVATNRAARQFETIDFNFRTSVNLHLQHGAWKQRLASG